MFSKGTPNFEGPNIFWATGTYVRTAMRTRHRSAMVGFIITGYAMWPGYCWVKVIMGGRRKKNKLVFFNGFLTTLLVFTEHSVTVVVADGSILVASFQVCTARYTCSFLTQALLLAPSWQVVTAYPYQCTLVSFQPLSQARRPFPSCLKKNLINLCSFVIRSGCLLASA